MQIISHPEKILFPDDGITKGELASYYARVAPVMLPHIRRRPVTMERYHRGIGAPGFFQKDVSKGVPCGAALALTIHYSPFTIYGFFVVSY